jgi:hypothetical protein
MDVIYQRFAWILGQSLAAYVVRGVLGIGLFTLGFMQVSAHPYLGLGLMLVALVPLGGCPTCWLAGMVGAACQYRAPQNQPPRQ